MRFITMSEAVSLIPGLLGTKIRYILYKKYLKSLGKDVTFQFGSVLAYRDIEIGSNVSIGQRTRIGYSKIGNDVRIGHGVIVLSGPLHFGFFRRDIPMCDQQEFVRRQKIEIGDDVFIGTASIIMADIPKGCVVSAGSVVKKKFNEYDIIEGNPAKPIYNRLTRKKYQEV